MASTEMLLEVRSWELCGIFAGAGVWRGFVLLGTPIGSHEFTIQAIRERIHKVKAFTACLALKWKRGRDTALDVNHCRPSCLTRLPPLQVMYLVWPTTGT